MINEMTIDEIVSYYIQLRDKKKELSDVLANKLKETNDMLGELEQFIKNKAEADDVTAFKTKHGTAYLETAASSSVKDWDALLAFIKENDLFYMLNKAVSKVAVKDYLDEHKELPPGVNYTTRVSVKVRRT